ncbi:MAG: hypothetical protein ACO3MW_08700, partial [Rhodospirillales bacterium]
MLDHLTDSATGSVRTLIPVHQKALAGWLQGQDPIVQKWIEQTEFEAKSGSFTLIPDAAGKVDVVLVGIGQETDIWKWAALPEKLPDGVYRLDASVSEV